MLTLNSNLLKSKRGQKALVADLQKLAKALITEDFANVSGKDSSHGFTYNLAKLIIKKITLNKEAKILILNDITLEMFYALLEVGYKRENIYIAFGKWNKDATVRDDTRLFNIMKNYVRANFIEEINIIELKEIFNMKFDLVIANPPYDGSLHLKILEKVLISVRKLNSNCEVISIQPVRWLEDPLAEYKKSTDYKKYKENIVDNITNLSIINSQDAKQLFDAKMDMDLGIFVLGSKHTECVSTYTPLASSIVKKIISKVNKMRTLDDVKEINTIEGIRVSINPILPTGAGKDYFVNVIKLRGEAVFKDGYSKDGVYWTETVRKSGSAIKQVGDLIRFSIKFDDFETAENFVTSHRTTFYKNLIFLIKLDQHSPLGFLPYMEDYSKAWTDEDYCKFFDLTKEESEFMCRKVDDYRIKDFINYINFED